MESGQYRLRTTRKKIYLEVGDGGKELPHLIFKLNGTVGLANATRSGKWLKTSLLVFKMLHRTDLQEHDVEPFYPNLDSREG